MNKLKGMFHPSSEELIRRYELLINIHTKNIGECCTCKHCIPTDLPGFVTDYGECELNKDIFPGKACGLNDVVCDCYKEDTDGVVALSREIERLKGEINHDSKTT